MPRASVLALACAGLVGLGCSKSTSATADSATPAGTTAKSFDKKAARAEILRGDSAFVRGLTSKNVDSLMPYYDPDVIYSFVALTDETVARIHEKYGPGHLVHHNPIGRTRGEEGYFRIQLPLKAVPSLSVVPALLSRTWGFGERLSDLRIIDEHFEQSSRSPFIKENFGFLGDTYQPMTGRNFPGLFGMGCGTDN